MFHSIHCGFIQEITRLIHDVNIQIFLLEAGMHGALISHAHPLIFTSLTQV